MDEKKRRFKLRNGGIIEEDRGIVWFTFAEEFDGIQESDRFEKGEEICLWEEDNGDITGGAFGPDYDVIEELFNEVGEG